jgi:hypothetical protein
MRGRVRGRYTPTCHHVKTLAATSSWLDPKTLATCEVLAHPHAAFHPYMCGLRRGAAAVAAALIGYDDMEFAVRMTTRMRRS